MASYIDEIFDILNECHNIDVRDKHVIETELIETNCIEEDLKRDIEKLLANKGYCVGSIEYASLNKMLAICNLKSNNEYQAIYHLIESHAVILRRQILHRSIKTEVRRMLSKSEPYEFKSSNIRFNSKEINGIDSLKAMLFELPKEWYMVQITSQYRSLDKFECTETNPYKVDEMHIIVLPTGTKETEPLLLTLPKPRLENFYDVFNEIHVLLTNNKSMLQATYTNNEVYWKMREKQNITMKTAIQTLENKWFREWKVLLIADPIEKLDIVADIVQMIDKLISDYRNLEKITERSRWLLKKITLGACFITKEEISRAVKYVLQDHPKLADNVILSIYGKLSCIEKLKHAKRKTLVLIVDEFMDYVPYESMEILRYHPITRFPSLHVAYTLFKEHESTMENGCKIIPIKSDMGACIVNPAGNLTKMEKRLRLFIEYWLPHWKSWYNVEPDQDMFKAVLTDCDILMYNGHGNGIQYIAPEHIERLKVKSVVLLFGCGSIKLLSVGGRFPPAGIANQYIIASSPAVLGTLWEITDGDIDKMTTHFISNWVPSPSKKPWSDVDINLWCSGVLKFKKNSQKSTQKVPLEPEMLRALAKSKDVCAQYMTAAAVVVRGLPIKLV